MADELDEEQQVVETRTKKQIAVEEHKAKAQVQAGAEKAINGLYLQAKNDLVFQDIVRTITNFIEWHAKLAKDGVGYSQDVNNKQVTVKFTPEERVSHLDKASAQQEILDYIDRRSN